MHEHHHDMDKAAIPLERQATCPVTGDMVDMQEAKTTGCVREYNSKTYYFCCNTCVRLFDKNPEKYAARKSI